MSFFGPETDRLAIRERIDAYSDAVFRRDADAWIDCWDDAATWDLMGHAVTGRDAILQTWLGAMDTFGFVGFHAFPGAMHVSGETATARVWVSEVLVPKDGGLRRVEGAYDDTLARGADGLWRFTRRAYRILHDDTSQ